MDFISEIEKNRGRVEKRRAFVTNDINWIENKKEWIGVKSIGAIKTEITRKIIQQNKGIIIYQAKI